MKQQYILTAMNNNILLFMKMTPGLIPEVVLLYFKYKISAKVSSNP